MRVRDETRSFYEAAVHRALARVVAGLDDALDLDALAREAALSPLHFHRVFRGMVGETPLELHRRLRLERAAARLATTDAPVTEIAFHAGYETHESFTRAFRARYGASPTELRDAARAAASGCARAPALELAAPSKIHFATLAQARLPSLLGASMNVDVVTLPALRLATVSHRGPYPAISQAFQRLGAIAGPAGLFRPGARMIALYHDDPESTPVADLRSEAALSVPEGATIPPGLSEVLVPAGRWAKTTHVGPYATLGDTWARLMGDWLPKSGHRVGSAPAYEEYLNDPTTTAPADLRTDLYVSLASG